MGEEEEEEEPIWQIISNYWLITSSIRTQNRMIVPNKSMPPNNLMADAADHNYTSLFLFPKMAIILNFLKIVKTIFAFLFQRLRRSLDNFFISIFNIYF